MVGARCTDLVTDLTASNNDVRAEHGVYARQKLSL